MSTCYTFTLPTCIDPHTRHTANLNEPLELCEGGMK